MLAALYIYLNATAGTLTSDEALDNLASFGYGQAARVEIGMAVVKTSAAMMVADALGIQPSNLSRL